MFYIVKFNEYDDPPKYFVKHKDDYACYNCEWHDNFNYAKPFIKINNALVEIYTIIKSNKDNFLFEIGDLGIVMSNMPYVDKLVWWNGEFNEDFYPEER